MRANPVCVDEVQNIAQFNVLTNISAASLVTSPAEIAAVTELTRLIAEEKCAPYYITSTNIVNRCIPTFINTEEFVNALFANLTLNETSGLRPAGLVDYFSNLTPSEVIEQIQEGTLANVALLAARQFFSDILSDLALAYPGLIGGFGVTLIIGFLYILLVRILAPVVVWGSVVLALLVAAGVSGVCWYQFYIYEHALDNANMTFNFDNYLSLNAIANATNLNNNVLTTYLLSFIPTNPYVRETWLAAAILFTLLLLVMILLIIFLAKAIQIAIKMLQEASRAVWAMPSSLFYPVVTWFFLFISVAWFILVALFLYSASEKRYFYSVSDRDAGTSWNITFSNGTAVQLSMQTQCDPNLFPNGSIPVTIGRADGTSRPGFLSCLFEDFYTNNVLIILHVYNFFGLLWMVNFWLAFGETVLAGTFGKWYWTFDKSKVPWFVIVGAFFRTLLFHAGTVAFGAFIIAVIQLLRAVLAYIQKKLKDEPGNATLKAIVQGLLCVCQCCLWLLEKFLRYINRQVYIMVAIYGYDFFKAACSVIKLLVANVEKVAIKDGAVSFTLFLGKIAIVGLVAVSSWILFSPFLGTYGFVIWSRPLHYYFIPVLILMFVAFVVASAFMSVYHMGVDTIFICFLDDLSRNNGVDRPYFMTKSLQRLMGVSNKVKPGDVQLDDLENNDGGKPA